MLPNAVTKSLQVISRCNLPFTTLQPFILDSCAAISPSLSFFAGMAFSSGPFHYAFEPRRQQRSVPGSTAKEAAAPREQGFGVNLFARSIVECARKILYCRGFLSRPKRR